MSKHTLFSLKLKKKIICYINGWYYRPPDKSVRITGNFFVISQPKHIYEPRHEISNNVVCATSKASDQPAHADQSLC